ncbi:GHKL domain-containing protein [Ktedonosporobacter rubrisoli]|uniref:histidine kinase n=1 Tax=Ktedonosporobacter rubrisoli TaxID=2509675 RepID=A0A4P6K3V3_KTERU|nr:ATP-binding protein [Ktedonosporobacter rubrisoli]QBD82652.1 GHKL domain-containing protein [Ktedonosporobacter rubrisoli]
MQQPIPELTQDKEMELEQLRQAYRSLLEEKEALEMRVVKSEERRRAFMHILSDINMMNRKLADQRKAMIHILADSERDRRHLTKQAERLDNSRRALLHILQDSHQSNQRLGNSRKAMIHIMSDLKETTERVQRSEQELLEKQEQLVQAGKLATLGELTTGIAHELNNPLNNIGLFVGNAIDLIELGMADTDQARVLQELYSSMQQVRKATEIISHLRTFGRVASVSREQVSIPQVIENAIALMREQLRLRQIEVTLCFPEEDVVVTANAIQLEQVFINLLTNARDAMANAAQKALTITCTVQEEVVNISISDTGPGIPVGLEQRIFDPFFTTKDVGTGTGLGLSITYGIIKDHQGTIQVENHPGEGATFLIQLPLQG